MKTMGIKFLVTLTFLQGHRISGNKTDCLHTSDTMFSVKLKFSMNVIYVHMYTHIGIADQPQKKFTRIYHTAECESFEHLLFLFIYVCVVPYRVKVRINFIASLKSDTFILLATVQESNMKTIRIYLQ